MIRYSLTKLDAFETVPKHVPGHPAQGHTPPAQSPQRVVLMTKIWSIKCVEVSHFELGKNATGLPQDEGRGYPAVISGGMPLRGNLQTFIPSSSQRWAKTPPPAALKLRPYELGALSRMPQPVLGLPMGVAHCWFVRVPVIAALGSARQLGPVWRVM